ncbi:MAG: hypothetical protein GX029_14205 [Pseudomonadaceae bacterium]|nr:hypothetical protein [Pseudomonadaceae bacterium]
MTEEIKKIIEQLESFENVTLHLSERGKRINVRAYAGYNRTTKRSDYVLLGSVGEHDFLPNDRLKAVLDGSKRIKEAFDAELEKYKESKAAEAAKDSREVKKMVADMRAEQLAECLEARLEDEDDISAELAASVYAAIKRAESVLRKAGHKKTNPNPNQGG